MSFSIKNDSAFCVPKTYPLKIKKEGLNIPINCFKLPLNFSPIPKLFSTKNGLQTKQKIKEDIKLPILFKPYQSPNNLQNSKLKNMPKSLHFGPALIINNSIIEKNEEYNTNLEENKKKIEEKKDNLKINKKFYYQLSSKSLNGKKKTGIFKNKTFDNKNNENNDQKINEKELIVSEIKTILNDLSWKEKKMNNKINFDNKILKNNEVLKKSSYILKKKPSSIKIIDKEKLIIENLPELQSQLIEPKIEEKDENDFNDNHINKKNILSNKNSFLLKIKQAKPNEHEIRGIKIKWKEGDMIGQGAFGQVFRAMNITNGNIFAVKKVIINTTGLIDRPYISDVEKELNILKEIRHPNIIDFYGYEEINNILYIYMEYMSGGNLSSLLKKYGSFSESTIKIYSKQILSALEYLHSRNFIHKDIKGANILVSNNGIIKLADFGCAQKLEKSLTFSKNDFNIVGSIPWMAPEVVNQTKYGKKSDIWSFGCVLIEMVTGKMPWENLHFENPIVAIMKIGTSNEIPEIPIGISKELKKFIEKCLVRDQNKRAGVDELLNDEFMKI